MALVKSLQYIQNGPAERFYARQWYDPSDTKQPQLQGVVLVDSEGNIVNPATSTPIAGTRYENSMLFSLITNSFQELLDPGVDVSSYQIINATDGDIIVSYDGGATEHWPLAPGKADEQSGFTLTTNIWIKYGTKAPNGGTVYALAYAAS